MPKYTWLIRNGLDKSKTEAKMRAMISLGVPYTDEDVARAQTWMDEQGAQIESNLMNDPDFKESYTEAKNAGNPEFIEMKDREVVALIAYLQRLGTDIKIENAEDVTAKNQP
jgi:cytochrome c oxidase cbb3-type subunit I/II